MERINTLRAVIAEESEYAETLARNFNAIGLDARSAEFTIHHVFVNKMGGINMGTVKSGPDLLAQCNDEISLMQDIEEQHKGALTEEFEMPSRTLKKARDKFAAFFEDHPELYNRDSYLPR